MVHSKPSSRRSFIKKIAASSALAAGWGLPTLAEETEALMLDAHYPTSPNERVRMASIGMGIIGFINVDVALQVPGVELVAVADCYDGRLARTQEVYGRDVFTTRDYTEILARDDIDAVLVNTPDHWHAQITIDALNAGKHVRCEKPMIQEIADGAQVIRAEKASGKVLHVGSSGINDIMTLKARELFAEGAIGQLNMVESVVSRNSAMGAWQYTIPPDASPETIDWPRFLGSAPQRAFDADRFFRWRKYWDYGTGIAGDMFVHRFTAFHRIIGSDGPTRAQATGSISFWNDRRETPDVMTVLYDYPATQSHPLFTLVMKANLADPSGGGPTFVMIGDEGVLTIGGGELTVTQRPRGQASLEGLVEGYNSVRTFAQAQQDAFVQEYQTYKPSVPSTDTHNVGATMTYRRPEGFNAGLIHMTKFFNAVRGAGTVLEDGTYGLRAAAASVIANHSYRERRPVTWDPIAMHMD